MNFNLHPYSNHNFDDPETVETLEQIEAFLEESIVTDTEDRSFDYTYGSYNGIHRDIRVMVQSEVVDLLINTTEWIGERNINTISSFVEDLFDFNTPVQYRKENVGLRKEIHVIDNEIINVKLWWEN